MPFSPPSPSDVIEDEKPSFVPPKLEDVVDFHPPSPEDEVGFIIPKPGDRTFHNLDGSEIPVSPRARSWLDSITGWMRTPGIEPPEQRRAETEEAMRASPWPSAFVPSAAEMTGNPDPSTIAKVVAGTGQAAANIYNSIVTKENAAIAGVLGPIGPLVTEGGATAVAAKAALTGSSAYFAAKLGEQLPQQAADFGAALGKGDLESSIAAGGTLAGTAAMGASLASHAATGAKELVSGARYALTPDLPSPNFEILPDLRTESEKEGTQTEKIVPPSIPVPESLATVEAQRDAARSPDSPKLAFTVSADGEIPSDTEGFTAHPIDQGTLFVNHEKVPELDEQGRIADDLNNGRGGIALGMSEDSKPAGSNLVLTAARNDGTEVVNQVVHPDGVEDAAEAAANAYPDDDLTFQVEHADEVLARRNGETEPLQGMGGATPGEFQPSASTPMSVRNARITEDAARLGMQDPVTAARQSQGDLWDQSMRIFDEDPAFIDRTIQRLRDDPFGSVTKNEQVALLHRNIDLQNELAKAKRDTAQAYSDGRTEDVDSGRLRIAGLRDQLQELFDINKKAGRSSSAALKARDLDANNDFSYAKMASDESERLGRPLTEPEKDTLQKTADDIEAKQAASDAAQANDNQSGSDAAVDDVIKAAKEEADKEPTGPQYSPEVLSFAEKMVRKWEKAAEESSKALREMLGRMSSGVDPTIIAHVAKIGLAKLGRASLDFTRWSSEMVKDFGDKISPFLKEGYDATLKLRDKALTEGKREAKKSGLDPEEVERAATRKTASGTPEAIADRIKEAAKEGRPVEEVGGMAHKLALALVRDGITQREPLVDYVHDALSEAYPEITRRESMDAISGLGRFKPLDQETAKATLRDLKGQMQQLGKLENLRAKEPLPKSGVEQRNPTAEERRLIQRVNEAKKRLGVVTTDPATQLRSTLDAIKKRLDNAIADSKDEIATRTRRTKAPSPTDAVIEAKRAELAELNRQKQEVFGRPELTDAQRLSAALKANERSIALEQERNAALNAGQPEPVRPVRASVSSPELEAGKARLEALRNENQQLRDQQNPRKTPEEIADARYRSILTRRLADYQQRLAAGDFSPRPKPPPRAYSPETIKKMAEVAGAKQDWTIGKLKDEAANRSFGEKAAAWAVKVARFGMLSHITIFSKLASATFARMATIPSGDLLGSSLEHLPAFDELGKRAPIEGGFNVRAVAKLWTQGLTKGLADMRDIWKTGSDNLDKAFGKGTTQILKDAHIDANAILDAAGKAHAMMKSVLKRGAFEYAVEKQLGWAARNNIDTTTPGAKMEIGLRAYDFAQRMIFNQENFLVDRYRRGLNSLDEPDKKTGVPSATARTLALALRATMPIVKIPTNIIGEAFEGQHGLFSGSWKFARAIKSGLDRLPPSEADTILRLIKNGSFGVALIALGYYNRKQIGGFWEPEVYKKSGEPKYGTVKVGDISVPSYLLHHMPGIQYEFGGSWGNIANQVDHAEQKGLLKGLGRSEIGLARGLPYGEEAGHLADILGPERNSTRALGGIAKSLLVPGLVQDAAQAADLDASGNVIKRSPKDILGHIKSGIPGARETVPKSTHQD